MSSSFVSVPNLIASFSRTSGLEVRLLEGRLKRQWPGIVGTYIASHTYPDSIKFRKLHVITENSVWLQQLVFLKQDLLEKIHRATPEPLVTDLLFRVGDISSAVPLSPQSEIPGNVSRPQLLREHLKWAEGLTQHIENPQLRRSITHVIATALSAK